MAPGELERTCSCQREQDIAMFFRLWYFTEDSAKDPRKQNSCLSSTFCISTTTELVPRVVQNRHSINIFLHPFPFSLKALYDPSPAILSPHTSAFTLSLLLPHDPPAEHTNNPISWSLHSVCFRSHFLTEASLNSPSERSGPSHPSNYSISLYSALCLVILLTL